MMGIMHQRLPLLLLAVVISTPFVCQAFHTPLHSVGSRWSIAASDTRRPPAILRQSSHRLRASKKDEATLEEEARLRVLESRRQQVRSSLKAAEALRNFRIEKDLVPELGEDGEPIKSDGKFALTSTAFVVAFGAIALRVGGRAALVKGMGLDFITENPELQDQVAQVLQITDAMDPITKGALFCLGWTLIKVLCFDAGGVVLALSSGILFGGVIQGAVISAFGATVGSSVAFALAKLDTPVRKKALTVVEENPSLRGIEKVVAKDGFKAILTLRLAPILPIPIGLYNYVYGVTNVPFLPFASGIFVASLKPYLLDSYLGFFGKSLVDGTASQDGGLQDIILLAALGFSVLIGVFASQLASETWDAVLEEVESEKDENGNDPKEDEVTTNLFGIDLPQWVVGFQYALKDADVRINELIDEEFEAKVWNYTKADGDNPVPREMNPALKPSSFEVQGAYKGFDLPGSLCDGLVLSPCMFAAFLKYADPLFDEAAETESRAERRAKNESQLAAEAVAGTTTLSSAPPTASETTATKEEILERISGLRDRVETRLGLIDAQIEAEKRM